jgi:hypothetical protein
MSEAIAAVVFDLDGVLINSESVWDAARREVVACNGASFLLARNGGTEVKTATLHCPVSTAQRMPSKKTARMGDEGKAVGFPILPGGFAVSAQKSGLRVTAPALCSPCRAGGWIETPHCQFDNHGRVRVGWGFEGTARPWGCWQSRWLGPRRLCCLSSRSIQDQQNQTRDQHNGHHPRHREY